MSLLLTLAEELRSIEEDLAELAATSADVSTTGQPSPGRGPIALAAGSTVGTG